MSERAIHGGRILLRLELDKDSEPLSGRLIAANGTEEEFEGLLALAAAIERQVRQDES
jgi:hypothetical protein